MPYSDAGTGHMRTSIRLGSQGQTLGSYYSPREICMVTEGLILCSKAVRIVSPLEPGDTGGAAVNLNFSRFGLRCAVTSQSGVAAVTP